MTGTIAPLLVGLSERANAAKDELQAYAADDPTGFRSEALAIVKAREDDSTCRYLLQLLLKHSRLAEYVADPAQSTSAEAIAVAKAAHELAAPLGPALSHILLHIVRDRSAGHVIVRIIDLLSALGLGKLILRLQRELISHADPRVCSKAVYELVRAGKGPALVAHTLLEGDPRVQANAVEALWDLQDKTVIPILAIAANSAHNRVVANALVGLYRHRCLDSVPQILALAAHPNPAHRASGIWAMGQTGDPRFLPLLNRVYGSSEGKVKTCAVRALSHIRKQRRPGGADVRMTLQKMEALEDGSRRLTVSLRAQDGIDLSSLSPMQFAIWEQGELVTDYSTQGIASPPVLIVGFGFPQFESKEDPYAVAVSQTVAACAALKRSTDPWRLERYFTEEGSRGNVKDSSASRDDASPLGQHIKNNRGFVTDSKFVTEILEDSDARDLASRDAAGVVRKLVGTASRAAGSRHLFVFFDTRNGLDEDAEALRRLAASLANQPLTMHGFAPGPEADYAVLRELCCATSGGTFQVVPIGNLERTVTQIYLGLMDCFEITYRVPNAETFPGCEVRAWTPDAAGALLVP